MASSIIVTGRGGTGKSTFAALAAGALSGTKLIVDADPDQCLSSLLGIDLRREGVKTVSEAMYDIQKGETDVSMDSMPLPEKVDYLLQLSCLYESDDFDLLTLGVKWTRGCYCAPNNALQTLISELASKYDYALFDSPAGLEHINRRVVGEVDDIFAIVDPSAKALRNAALVADIARSIDFNYKNLYTVANFRFPADRIGSLKNMENARYLGKVEEDPQVESLDWSGRSLLELPAESPACRSVRELLKKAGYDMR